MAYFLQVSIKFVSLSGIFLKLEASTWILVDLRLKKASRKPGSIHFAASGESQWGAIELLVLLRLLPLV